MKGWWLITLASDKIVTAIDRTDSQRLSLSLSLRTFRSVDIAMYVVYVLAQLSMKHIRINVWKEDQIYSGRSLLLVGCATD